MGGLSFGYPPDPTSRMRELLRFRQIALTSAQRFFRPLEVLDIKGGCVPFDQFCCLVIKRHSAKQEPAIHSIESASACLALARFTRHQHRFPLLRKAREIIGMDHRLPLRTAL